MIFNTGRCGSTLLAKVLARSRKNLVLSEAAPHNEVWQCLSEGPEGMTLYRNLLLAMGRTRGTNCEAHIIKFTSVSMVHFDFIRAAFPGVPALFLFREPRAVLSSYARRSFPWSEWMGGSFGKWTGANEAVEDLCGRALRIDGNDSDVLITGISGLSFCLKFSIFCN